MSVVACRGRAIRVNAGPVIVNPLLLRYYRMAGIQIRAVVCHWRCPEVRELREPG